MSALSTAADEGRTLSPATIMALEDMKAIVADGNAQWRTLPPHAYKSQEIFELEKERIFLPGWILIGRPEQVPNPGDYMSLDVLDEPIVMLRDRSGELRVLSRVCRHRWAPVCHGNGNATVFVCPYHAWTYNLDGSLRGAPAMEATPSFNKKERGLFKIRHEVWQGFVFINLDGQAEPLAKQLAPAVDELKEFGLSDWKLVRTRDLGECPWDWKVFMDNGECYHHLGAHRTTFESDYPAANSWDSPNNGNYTLTWCRAKDGEELIARTMRAANMVPGLTDTQRLNMCLLYVFPNYFICPSPTTMMTMRVFPLGPGRIRVFADYSVPPHIEAGPELEARLDSYEKFVDLFNGEDTAVCTLAQRGLQSQMATSAPLSRLEGHNRDFALWVSRKLTSVRPE